MVKVLITGGCGHIGSYLIRKLPSKYKITVVDNLLTQRYCSLFDLDRGIKFIEKDIDGLTEDDVVGIDVVIHLAAITNAEGSFKNKEEVENVNIVKTEKFIGLCKKVGISYFIFPSSTSVYGASVDVVYEDDDSVVNPQSPYAETKIGIENLLKNNLAKLDENYTYVDENRNRIDIDINTSKDWNIAELLFKLI